jgi:hypothetical protein
MIFCQYCGARVADEAKWCPGCGLKARIGHAHIVLGWCFVVLLLGYFAANGDFWSPIFIAGVAAVGVCMIGQIIHLKRLRDQIVRETS